MGQQQPVQVYVLVTEGTIEEGLLNTLAAERDLAMVALDPDSDVTQVDLTSGVDELRRRLEVLLGAPRPGDMSQKQEVVAEGSNSPSAASGWRQPAARCSAPS